MSDIPRIVHTLEEKLIAFNGIWAVMGMRPLTKDEFEKELLEHPNLLQSYYLQQEVSKKYHGNI